MLAPLRFYLRTRGRSYWNALVEKHEIWHVLTSLWLHIGFFHLFINLETLIFVGIYMEQQYGPRRIAVIYFPPALFLFGGLFVRNIPSVCSRVFLLISGNLSLLIMACLCCRFQYFHICFLPYIDNFLRQDPSTHEGKMFEDDIIVPQGLKKCLQAGVEDCKPGLVLLPRILIAVCWGINLNCHCNWCRYDDCVLTRKWSCSDMNTSCEGDAQLTLTSMANGKFGKLPSTNISQARTQDLCTLV
ncbi:hypothetical protein Bca4012_038924 [Brassica carinata]|uniref:RHOMBOID-like protein n=1 Tax=Brassica carinata TaxID=52824 RepID=A0A8X7W5Q9_BRACI|nr:hypothetical protein Bca52824_007136 [Brassica carinata]